MSGEDRPPSDEANNDIAPEERTNLTGTADGANYQSIDTPPEEDERFRPFFLADEETMRSRRELLYETTKKSGKYTVDDGMEYIGLGKYHYIWLAVFGVSSMSQSVELTLTSVILNSIGCEWHLTVFEKVLIPCVVLLAAVPGDFVGGYLADKYGRKPILLIGQILIAVFGVLSAFMPDYISFVIVRCLVGFGFGITVVIVIVQVVEICPTTYRASAVALMFISWSVGVCYTVIGAYFLLNSSYGWRAVVLWAAFPCVVLLFVLPFMDNSPKYLVISEVDNTAARDLLHKIAQTNGVDFELDEVGDLLVEMEQERGTLRDLGNEEFRTRTICFVICLFFANTLYISNVYDTAYLFDSGYCSAGGTTSSSSCTFTLKDLLLDLVVSIGEFLAVPIVAVSSELQGRLASIRTLAILLSIVIFACIWCFGEILLLCELFVTRALTDASFLLFFIYVPESYPTYMRSVAFGVTNLFANIGGVVGILLVYLVGLAISWKLMFTILFVFSLVIVITSWILKHETVGVRLQDNRENHDHFVNIPANAEVERDINMQ